MKMVYILTKEGREYTKEGCLYVTSKIREYFKETEEFVFGEGAVYNNTELFKELLLSHLETDDTPGCYIVVSHSYGIAICGGTRTIVENFITDVERHPGESTWEIFYGECTADEDQ